MQHNMQASNSGRQSDPRHADTPFVSATQQQTSASAFGPLIEGSPLFDTVFSLMHGSPEPENAFPSSLDDDETGFSTNGQRPTPGAPPPRAARPGESGSTTKGERPMPGAPPPIAARTGEAPAEYSRINPDTGSIWTYDELMLVLKASLLHYFCYFLAFLWLAAVMHQLASFCVSHDCADCTVSKISACMSIVNASHGSAQPLSIIVCCTSTHLYWLLLGIFSHDTVGNKLPHLEACRCASLLASDAVAA